MNENSQLPQRHKDFALFMVMQGLAATQAYQKVYPDASPESAKVSASRLLTQDNVIAEVKRLNQEKEQKLVDSVAPVDHKPLWTLQRIEQLRKELYEDPKCPHAVKRALLDDAFKALPETSDSGSIKISWGD